MAKKTTQKSKPSKNAAVKKKTKRKADQTKVGAKSVARKKRVKPPQVKQRLVVGGTFVDLEWGVLDAAIARKILKDGIAETDAWSLLNNSEVGLTSEFFVSLDDKILEIEIVSLKGKLRKTRMGKSKRWMMIKEESGDGEVYSAEIEGIFDENKLRFSYEKLSNGSVKYTLVTPDYEGIYFDSGDFSTSSQSWYLIDPDGQEHDFELQDE
jgi:hypothetical protein